MTKRAILLVCLVFAGISAFGLTGRAEELEVETRAYLHLEQDVYYLPSQTKMPLVVLSHNGASSKDGWGDFPQELARAGFFVINVNWSLDGPDDLAQAITSALNKYAGKIDRTRVAFVGGCHGATKLVKLFARGTFHGGVIYQVKTIVALSISEKDEEMVKAFQKPHPPVLAIYTTRDRYGYTRINREVAEEIITEPKKVVAFEATPHGHSIVVDEATKAEARGIVITWLKEHLQ
jgi:dienelactone hydrolase